MASSAPKRGRRVFVYGYRRIVMLLVALVIVPSVLLSSVGVLLMVLRKADLNILLGILVLTFTSAVITGVVLVWVFVRRDAKLSELQADFVSKVSHELRTPLTSIRMFTDTLALRRGNPEVEARCIEALQREGQRLQELIDRLLDWGRMESGRRKYDLATHSLREIVDAAVGAFAPTRDGKDVDLKIELADPEQQIYCDKGAIKDALVNLISNAYKYGGTPPVIEISSNQSSDFSQLSVKDNGAGIEPREHKRIFQKFYRIDDRLAREKEGSGLGLAIVQHVLRAHDGYVEISSELGKGSTFTLVIPRAPTGPSWPSVTRQSVAPKAE